MCPFLDESNPRCAVHQSLQNLHDALRLCAGDHESCPVYREASLTDARRHPLAKAARIAG